MLIISASGQERIINMKKAIEAVASSLKYFSTGEAVTPIRTAIPIVKGGGTALFMPSSVESEASLGVKFVSVFPTNKQKGKETIYGVLVLADIETGEPLALMEASSLTALRTGAVAGLATELLSRKNSKVLSVIGTGKQSLGIINAILTVRDIKEIHLYNRSIEKAQRLSNLLEEKALDKQGVIKVHEHPEEAVRLADILVTATNSTGPVLSEAWVRPGTHINAIGSFRPDMQEIPTELLKRAGRVIVESKEAALEETGDLIIPIKKGDFSPEGTLTELGEIIAGSESGRQLNEEITLFKSVGLATMDVVVAKQVYDLALRAGIGQKVSIY
jgi:ornithine cyclodeaminase